MSKKHASDKTPSKEMDSTAPVQKEPVLSVMSGMFIVLITVVMDIAITRYILNKWSNLTVDFNYMIYETAITVICSAGLVVFLNFIRVSEACEKAQSADEFPCGGPFGFLAGNPIILWIEVSIIMGILFTGFNGLLFKLLGFASWSTLLFFIYKFVYCLIMVIAIHWAVLGRMLQPDWLNQKIQEKRTDKVQERHAPINKNKR